MRRRDSGIQENIVSWPKMLKARRVSIRALRGIIHFSDRASTEVDFAPVWTTNSRASTAEAPPPTMSTFLPCGGFPIEFGGVVDFAFEGFLAGYVRDFGVAAASDSGHDAVEAAVRRVIDDPAGLLVLINRGDAGVEFGAGLQAVAFPELGYLGDDLLAVGVAGGPADGGVETVHYAMDLETGCVVYLLGDWLASGLLEEEGGGLVKL